MTDVAKDKDQKKGDAILRRLLKTPPDHKTGKGEKAPPKLVDQRDGKQDKRR